MTPICPHCRDNQDRRAVITIDGEYWCEVCAPEVWALMEAGRAALRGTADWRTRLQDSIAALEVKA